MDKSFQVELLSPEKPLASVSVDRVHLPGVKGYLGIGANHAPFLSKLQAGIVTLEESNKGSYSYFVSGGYAQILNNKATVLVEVIEKPDEIDVERAKQAERRALERLEGASDLDLDIPRALSSLERARARLSLAQKS